MRIALDARTMLAPRPRGTGRNLLDAYRLIPQLRPDWEFVLYHQRPLSTPDDIAGDRGTVSAWRWSEAGATVAATLESASPWRQPNVQLRRIDLPGDRFDAWFHVRLPVALRRDRPDLVHFPANAAPAWCPVPFVVTVHDLIPLMLAGETPAAEVHAFERGLCRALRRAAHVITPSAATRAELHERFGVPLDGMTVIPWAADTHIAAQVGPGGGSARGSARDPARVADLRARLGLGPRWLVLFAGGTPRKNAAGALAAFARVPTEIRREIQLVLVGCEPAERRAALVETAERLGLGGRGSGRVEASGERPPFGGGTERAGADGSAGAAPCPTCG
ncbi:MAG: glycosyltransferase, partial [Planctomycetota bacterium]